MNQLFARHCRILDVVQGAGPKEATMDSDLVQLVIFEDCTHAEKPGWIGRQVLQKNYSRNCSVKKIVNEDVAFDVRCSDQMD
jgi:hypothetical protein